MLQFFGGGDNLLCVCVCSCAGFFTDCSVVIVVVVAVCFCECQREWQALRAQLEQQIVDLRASLVSSRRFLVFSEGSGDSASVFVFCTTKCRFAAVFLSGRCTDWQCGCGGDGGSDSSVTTSRCCTICPLSHGGRYLLFDVLHAVCTTTRFKFDFEKCLVVRLDRSSSLPRV